MVLLLGSNGFLGRNVLSALLRDGHTVVCLLRNAAALRGCEFEPAVSSGALTIVQGSLLDYAMLQSASCGCDAVVNCAGVTDMSLISYDDYLVVNRDLPHLLVRLLEDNQGLRSLVVSSSLA